MADPRVSRETLSGILDAGGDGFAASVIDHGLGPLWHERSGREEFRDSRLAAEALFLLQRDTLNQIDEVLEAAGVEHAVIKGAANRLSLYPRPALRACHDLDLLVRPADRLAAATALAGAGFVPRPEARSISRAIVLSGRHVDVDLHWGLLREGRARLDTTSDMLSRRQRLGTTWILSDEDALFVLLVHPAFAKHLDAREMGLHRALDLLEWLRQRRADWPAVRIRLGEAGVKTAAWATLRWVQLLAGASAPAQLASMQDDLLPGRLRRAWLQNWLAADMSSRTARLRWLRLAAFSTLLHDTPPDAWRAYRGRLAARRRVGVDVGHFAGLLGE